MDSVYSVDHVLPNNRVTVYSVDIPRLGSVCLLEVYRLLAHSPVHNLHRGLEVVLLLVVGLGAQIRNGGRAGSFDFTQFQLIPVVTNDAVAAKLVMGFFRVG